jgi:hypothetical protein
LAVIERFGVLAEDLFGLRKEAFIGFKAVGIVVDSRDGPEAGALKAEAKATGAAEEVEARKLGHLHNLFRFVFEVQRLCQNG